MKLSKQDVLAHANSICKNTLMETLSIKFIDFGDDFVIAKMPVNSKVFQPDGILHGGATVALAETTGSFAAHMFLDLTEVFVRGIEISANHVKSVSSGYVFAKATILHIGKTTQLWQVPITNEKGELISFSELSVSGRIINAYNALRLADFLSSKK